MIYFLDRAKKGRLFMNRNIMIQTLRRFKVTSGYKGEKHETSFYNVERGIRVVVDKCWKEDKELMMEILGYHAIKCPSNSEFLDAFTFFCENR